MFLRDQHVFKRKKPKVPAVPVICNPSTRQSWALPKVKSRRKIGVMSYLGYDPIDKQYKVLSMTWENHGRQIAVSEEHQVMTLGTEEPSWRKIKCCIPHFPQQDDICINGVLYYKAVNISSSDSIIICFDVRLETFRFIIIESFATASGNPPLVNYKGKLGLFMSGGSPCVHGLSIELRVLQDVEKQEWSEHMYVLPSLRQIVGNPFLSYVGVTPKNEIVLSSCYQTVLFYVFYYNTITNTITSVEIQGMEAFKCNRVTPT